MKINEILTEYQRVTIHPLTYRKGQTVTGEVTLYKNPSYSELLKFLENDDVRGILYSDALYIWPASIIYHGGVKLQFTDRALCDLYFSKSIENVQASEWRNFMKPINDVCIGFNIYRHLTPKAKSLLQRVLGITDFPENLYESVSNNQITYDDIIKKYPEPIIISDLNDVSEWMGSYNNPYDPRKLIYQFHEENIENYKHEILPMLDSYDEFPKDKARTNKIVNILKKTKRQLPIFVDGNDNFIMEGRHRIVAFHLAGYKTVPVITVTKPKDTSI